MQTLRLFIAPDWPQAQRECRWALCAADGAILQHGYSEPRHWPGVVAPDQAAAQRSPLACDIVLLGAQVCAIELQLPRGAAGLRPEVVAAASEESLLDEPADCQFVRSPRAQAGEDGKVCLAYMARARLAALSATLGELGLSPRSAWPLGFLLPEVDGQTLAWAEDGLLTLPQPGGAFVALDTAEEWPLWQDRLASTGNPQALPIVDREKDPQARPVLDRAIAAGILDKATRASEAGQLLPPPPGGLLNGPLAPPKPASRLLERLRRPLQLLAGLALLAFGLLLADWTRLAWQARAYRADIEAQYRQAFPQGALVDPALQMQRQLDQARRQAGQLASQDLLTLLAPLAEIAGDLETGRLDYDGRRLTVAAKLPAEALPPLVERARQAGLRLDIARRESAGNRLDLTFSLSPETSR